jgi:hypothetical protein
MQQQLDLLDTRLKDRKAVTVVASDANLKFAQKIQKPPMRPSTPINTTKPVKEIQRAASALLIQKIIRGRIIQNLMYQGKERRKELISELRIRQMHRAVSTQPELITPSKMIKSEEKRRNISELDGLKEHDTTDEFEYTDNSKKVEHQEVLGPIQSEYTARSIDFLTKELVRLRQEQLISSVVKMAERTRRMREAVETGRRKQELGRRRIEESVFSQLMSVHAQSVDSYLEQVIESSVDITSATKARINAGEYAEKINTIVDTLEDNETNRYVSISYFKGLKLSLIWFLVSLCQRLIDARFVQS